MKLKHILTASILTLSTVCVSQAAEVVLHVTGSTAFRKAFVQAVEDQMSGSAYTVAYLGATPTVVGTELGVNDVVLRGTINGQAVTVKCDWTGSLGGVLAVSKQISPLAGNIPGAKGWMSITNLPASGAGSPAIVTGNQTLLAAGTSPSFALDTTTFSTETNAADVTMSDSFQASTAFFKKPVLPSASAGNEVVGVVPFEWVANNGAQSSLQSTVTAPTTGGSTTITLSAAPSIGVVNLNSQLNVPNGNGAGVTYFGHVIAVSGLTLTMDTAPTATVAGTGSTLYYANPISNLNTNQANQMLTGGLYLSQLSGNTTTGDGTIDDNATFVYGIGRNFDSGTRLAAMNEAGLGTAVSILEQMVPNDANTGSSGTAGTPAAITSFAQTPQVSIYPTGSTQTFGIGNDGFASGGTLAGWLEQTGSYGAAPTAADQTNGLAPLYDGLGTEGGWLVGYLGRSDADTAVTSSAAAPNTAHRVTWNGAADWAAGQATKNIAFNAYQDVQAEEGVYTFWEYEHFLAKNGGLASGQTTVCNGIATQLTGVSTGGATLVGSADVPLTGILSSHMDVSKTSEGGIITHN